MFLAVLFSIIYNYSLNKYRNYEDGYYFKDLFSDEGEPAIPPKDNSEARTFSVLVWAFLGGNLGPFAVLFVIHFFTHYEVATKKLLCCCF